MTEHIQVKIAPTLVAPVAGIRRVKPNNLAEFVKCEGYVNAGFFFDGTNNNRDRDLPNLGHSNIARLFDTYQENPKLGYFKTYLPGVGTRFPQIGEFSESNLGNGFGIGCEARVLYAMLDLLNSISRMALSDQRCFTAPQMKALCSVGMKVKASSADIAALAALGLGTGLLMPEFFGKGNRDDFLRSEIQKLELKLKQKGKPVIKECFIDVFGFSRGAAEARVFCNWLERLLWAGKFAGIPFRFRFVGLIDTVASGGFWATSWAGVSKIPGGHSGWASADYLRIPAILENCVHMVAMHELRKNFPLDEAGVNGVLPSNTQEFAYPGAHSDVGGGYKPNEFGISVGKDDKESDALKLSQVPLNHMLACAIAAGAPMTKERAPLVAGADVFSVSPLVDNAYNGFLAESGIAARAINEWLQPYLNWRWQNRLVYESLDHVKKSSQKDREVLIKFNKILINDAGLIQRLSNKGRVTRILSMVGRPLNTADEFGASFLDEEANTVLTKAQKAAKVSPTLSHFFDSYVHDSLAGFNKPLLEETGYWRYRKGFAGGEDGGIVFNGTEAGGNQAA